MQWLNSLSEWASAHSTAIWCISAVSLVLLVATPFVAAWAVAKLPRDYFAREHRRPLKSLERYPALRIAVIGAKSLLGILLVIAGLVMLVAPGQGVLTLLAGLLLIEFPGKYRVECWLVSRRQVWRSINWLRRRLGRPELQAPPHSCRGAN
jgi:hypothetical protein